MEVWDSNLHAIIKPLMGDVSAVMSSYADPNGPFDPMETLIGQEEVTSQGETPQVYWIPVSDDGYHVADEQPDNGVALYVTWTTCRVVCWGGNLGEAERLRNAVLVKAHERYSAAAVKPMGKATYSKGLSTGDRGVTITLTMAFKIPILAQVFLPARVLVVNVQPAPGVQPPPITNPATPGGYGVVLSDVLGNGLEPMEP